MKSSRARHPHHERDARERERQRKGSPTGDALGSATTGAGVILIVVALAQGGLAMHFAPIGWAAVLILAVVSTVLAFLAFLRGLAEIGPVRTAIVSTIEPFWTALLGSAVLGQQIGMQTLAGGLLIAAAVILLQLGHRATAAPAPAS